MTVSNKLKVVLWESETTTGKAISGPLLISNRNQLLVVMSSPLHTMTEGEERRHWALFDCLIYEIC